MFTVSKNVTEGWKLVIHYCGALSVGLRLSQLIRGKREPESKCDLLRHMCISFIFMHHVNTKMFFYTLKAFYSQRTPFSTNTGHQQVFRTRWEPVSTDGRCLFWAALLESYNCGLQNASI